MLTKVDGDGAGSWEDCKGTFDSTQEAKRYVVKEGWDSGKYRVICVTAEFEATTKTVEKVVLT